MGRQFIDTLNDIRQGAIADEMGEQLADLIQTIRGTGGKGSISLTLTVKPASKNNTDQLIVHDAITVKKPKPEQGTTILFATAEGGLTRRDPRQPELPMRPKAIAPTPIDRQSAASGE